MERSAKKYTLEYIFRGERLQGFSDAVFAIIATFMVVPLTNHIMNHHEVANLAPNLFDEILLIKYSIYFFSYAMVLDTWFTHVAVFDIVQCVDDLILNLNLLVLLLVSFLPFTYVLLVSSFGQHLNSSTTRLSIALCSGDIAITGFLMAVILVYAFWKKRLIHPEIINSLEIHLIQRSSLVSVLIKPLLALLTFIVTLTTKNNFVSLGLFYAIGAITILTKIILYVYFKKVKKTSDRLTRHIFKTVASKSRIEFFSDGVFSIVATLLVLSTTTQAGSTINNKDFSRLLINRPYAITSYLISFTVVGFLWLIHHQMFHFIKKLTPLLIIINFGILFLVGLLPFASRLDSKYSSHVSRYPQAKNTAVQVKCSIALATGLLETVFWIVAVWNHEKCMSNEAKYYQYETVQFCKGMVIPTVSLIVYFGCLLDGFVINHIDIAFFLSIPCLYLLLDGIFQFYGNFKQKKVLNMSVMVEASEVKEAEFIEMESIEKEFKAQGSHIMMATIQHMKNENCGTED